MIYFCPTPIGNMGDITYRSLEVLRNVDIIACEDTRNSMKLLNHFNIKKKLISYHKFNEKKMAQEIINLSNDNDIAIITDAGLPGISDPGYILIKELVDKNLEFCVLPGGSAALTGLVLSGLNTEHFLFYGFVNSKSTKRKTELDGLKKFPYTLIFYEAPHRLVEFLEDLYEIFGNRRVSISRELTKMFETTYRGMLEDILKNFDITLKGEFVIVVDGFVKEDVNIDIKSEILKEMANGFKKSKAVKNVALKYNLSKNEVYKISLEVEDE